MPESARLRRICLRWSVLPDAYLRQPAPPPTRMVNIITGMFVDGATEDDWELNAELRANMQEPEWIVADTAVHPVKAEATDATEYQDPKIKVS